MTVGPSPGKSVASTTNKTNTDNELPHLTPPPIIVPPIPLVIIPRKGNGHSVAHTVGSAAGNVKTAYKKSTGIPPDGPVRSR